MKTSISFFAAMSVAACAATTPPSAPVHVMPLSTAASSATPATTGMPEKSAPVTAGAAPASPPPTLLKLAKLAGYHTRKLKEGTTVFCKEEAHLGSRFSTESCIDEVQLQEFLIRAQDQRDKLKNRRGTGTDFP